jgi:predicted HicB family RNase H-like nuclease
MVAETVLEDMTGKGHTPPESQVLASFSGQIRVRMPRTLHQRLAGRARIEDVSLNTLIVSLLAEGIGATEGLAADGRKTRRPKKSASAG